MRVRAGHRQHLRGDHRQHHRPLRGTAPPTQEAITCCAQLAPTHPLTPHSLPPHSLSAAQRTQFYQDKIKRLLARTDVQLCLGGRSQAGGELRREIARMREHAPEQARSLLTHFRTHLQQQESMIEQSLARQKENLSDRIRRRSSSRRAKPHQESSMMRSLLLRP